GVLGRVPARAGLGLVAPAPGGEKRPKTPEVPRRSLPSLLERTALRVERADEVEISLVTRRARLRFLAEEMEPQVLDVDGRAQPNRLHEERLSHAVDLADRHVERSEAAQVDPPASARADGLADELAKLPQALEVEPEERDSDEDWKEEELRPAQVLPVEAIGIEDALVTRKEVIRPRAEDIAHDGAAIPPQGLEDIVAEGLANLLVAFDRRTEEVERGEGGGRELGHELVV